MRPDGYRHSPDMGEISGFGGGYEILCQDMLNAGVVWLDRHPRAKLAISTIDNVYGPGGGRVARRPEAGRCGHGDLEGRSDVGHASGRHEPPAVDREERLGRVRKTNERSKAT